MTAIRTVAETGSTNDDLASLAREGAPEGVWLARLGAMSGGAAGTVRKGHSASRQPLREPARRLAPGATRRGRRWLWSLPWRCPRWPSPSPSRE